MNKIELLKKVDQAFLPAKEIEIPELFSGREEEIVQGIHALRSEGASLCVYGRRGVGKTSFAKQLRLVAAGHPTLVELIQKPELFDADLFHMPSIYFACDDTIKDANDLFRKILCDRDSLNGICKYNNGVIVEKTKKKTSKTAKMTLKLLNASLNEGEEVEGLLADIDPIAAFKSVTSEIVDASGSIAMVVVIDEFERIAEKAGIASIIRTCPHVKFIIVGIADDIEMLIRDHMSIHRQLLGGTIELRPMTNEMLVGIIRRAEMLLEKIHFEEDVIAHIIALSNGYPHWVHLLGRHSCIKVVDEGEEVVRMEHYTKALEQVVRYEPHYEKMYKEIVSTSAINEQILKLLALDNAEEHNLDQIKRDIQKLGIKFKSVEQYLKLLEKRDIICRKQNIFNFRDAFFKVFARIRPPIFKEAAYAKPVEEYFSSLAYSIRQWTLPTTYLFDNLSNSYKFVDSLGIQVFDSTQYIPIETVEIPSPRQDEGKKFRRFDECPCGSGKKRGKCGCGIY